AGDRLHERGRGAVRGGGLDPADPGADLSRTGHFTGTTSEAPSGADARRGGNRGEGGRDEIVTKLPPSLRRALGECVTSTAFMVIAHRGASSYAPENTFGAFDLAIEMGVTHLELDVHLTRDEHLVVIHDDTVDRTTDGVGSVTDHTLAALRTLDAGAWFD